MCHANKEVCKVTDNVFKVFLCPLSQWILCMNGKCFDKDRNTDWCVCFRQIVCHSLHVATYGESYWKNYIISNGFICNHSPSPSPIEVNESLECYIKLTMWKVVFAVSSVTPQRMTWVWNEIWYAPWTSRNELKIWIKRDLCEELGNEREVSYRTDEMNP